MKIWAARCRDEELEIDFVEVKETAKNYIIVGDSPLLFNCKRHLSKFGWRDHKIKYCFTKKEALKECKLILEQKLKIAQSNLNIFNEAQSKQS